MRPKLEDHFRDELVKFFRDKIGVAYYLKKNHGSAVSIGFPDMTIVVRGQVGFFELKSVGGPARTQTKVLKESTFRDAQLVTLSSIGMAQGPAYGLIHVGSPICSLVRLDWYDCLRVRESGGVKWTALQGLPSFRVFPWPVVHGQEAPFLDFLMG